MVELSDRLKMVASQVLPCDLMVDVGTDHAYVPIYLYKQNIIKQAIAADISRGSCDKAMKNIDYYRCEDYIDTRCGDGLAVVNDNENPDCVVIAGMGGMLTIDVLESNKRVVNGLKRLVVQPQRNIDRVRRYLHNIGYKIINENMLFEDGKYYNVITAEHGEDDNYSDMDYYFGKLLIEQKSNVLKSYITFEKNKLEIVALSLYDKDSEDIRKRKEEIKNTLMIYEEVLKCL